jgi:hypothetical protein
MRTARAALAGPGLDTGASPEGDAAAGSAEDGGACFRSALQRAAVVGDANLLEKSR